MQDKTYEELVLQAMSEQEEPNISWDEVTSKLEKREEELQ